jgi:hypothetical protein
VPLWNCQLSLAPTFSTYSQQCGSAFVDHYLRHIVTVCWFIWPILHIVNHSCVDELTIADDEMEDSPQKGQDVVDNLVILDAIVPTIHERLWPRLYSLFPQVVLALRSRFAVVRQLAAQSFATMCDVTTPEAMRYLVDHVLPLLGDPMVLTNRQGAIELIYRQLFCFVLFFPC